MGQIFIGKFKGQDEEAVAKTEKGRSWMRWIADQPVKDGEYKEKNLTRNKKWTELCNQYDGKEQVISPLVNTPTNSVAQVKLDAILGIVKEIREFTKPIKSELPPPVTKEEMAEEVGWDEKDSQDWQV